MAILARKLGRRAPTPRHTYGLKRAEVIAALINAAVLIAISVLIAREAVVRLLHPEPVHAPIMLMAAAVALVANVASVLLLRAHHADDVNVRSAFLHLARMPWLPSRSWWRRCSPERPWGSMSIRPRLS